MPLLPLKHPTDDFDIVEVFWLDHTSVSGWISSPDAAEAPPLHCRTAGYLVAEEAGYYRIAQSANDNAFGDILTILKSHTTELKYIRKAKNGKNGKRKGTK